MSNVNIGEKIKAKRRERDFTQEELAGILGVSKAAVCKWETGESYPDITLLPQIAQLFHITMDELFGYALEYKPLKIVNEYRFGFSLDDMDRKILDHGTVKECKLVNCGTFNGQEWESAWQVRVAFTSGEENFPYIVQKYVKPGVVVDGVSQRIADGKVIDDDKPNKHFVCREKVWEYNIKDKKYIRQMLKELREMGLLDNDE